MKNLITSKASKILSNKMLLFILLEFILFTPNNSYSQNNLTPIPLAGFSCHFTNLDGQSVISCASIVKATISFPITSSPIQRIKLIYPNTFQIIDVEGGSIVGSQSNVAAGNYNGTILQEGQLISSLFTPGTNGIMKVMFRYVSCTSSNSSQSNTVGLFFDCEGGPIGNESHYYAILNNINNNPTSEPLIATELGGQIARVYHSNLPPLQISSISNSNFQNVSGHNYNRRFSVIINSMSITTFDLSIVLENDIDFSSNPLSIVSPANTLTSITSFIFGTSNWNNHQIANYPYTTTGFTRTITFEQNCTLVCNSTNPQETNIQARTSCECGPPNSDYFITPILSLNGTIGTTAPVITLIGADLNSVDGTTEFCTGNYNYKVGFQFNGSISRLMSIRIPINTTSFVVTGISIANADGVYQTFPYQLNNPNTANSTINIYVDNIFASGPPNWQGFQNELGNFDGAWIIPITRLSIIIHLSYQCSNTNNCQDPRIFLTPLDNNQAVFIMRNTCDLPILIQPTGTNPTVNLNNIGSPNIPPATVTGLGCVNLVYTLPNSSSIPFEYTLTIPNQSPFAINYLSNVNNNLIDCEDKQYRAVLRINSPGGFNLSNSNLSQVFVNGNPIDASDIYHLNNNAEIAIELPNPISNQQSTVYDLSFYLAGIECPNPVETFGSFTYTLTVQVICNSCGSSNPCIRNIGCTNPVIPDILNVHCPGPCEGVIGIRPDVTMKRSTFGWVSDIAYNNNNPPIENESFFNNLPPAQKEEQLRSLYPFDIFNFKAEGEVSAFNIPDGFNDDELHTSIGIQLNSSQTPLGSNFLNYIEYDATFIRTTGTPITIDISNIASGTAIQVPMDWNSIASSSTTMADFPIRWELMWSAADLNTAGININEGNWRILFSAKFRLNATEPSGLWSVDVISQFISHSDLNNNYQSCDPYGATLEMLIPQVEIAQRSAQTGPLNLGINNVTVYNITENEACNFYHAVGVTHFGGRGNIPDFPFEYRPLTSWPASITSSDILNVYGFSGTSDIYSSESPFTNTADVDHLLPTKKREEISPNQYRGLVLKLARDCPNTETIAAGSPTISFPLEIDQYAYIHSGHLLSPLPHLPYNATPAAMPASLSCNSNFVSFSQPTGIINVSDVESVQNFNLSAPSQAEGLPVAFRLSNTNINVSLTDFSFNGSLIPIGLDGWYSFPNGLTNTNNNNASFKINLVPGCFSDPFDVIFDWRVFCNESQLSDFIISPANANACMSCSTSRTFQRGVSTIDNLILTNGFSADNNCNFVWTLNLENPINLPSIFNTELDLNFTTGMIYNNHIITKNNIDGTTTTLPTFPLNFNLNVNNSPNINYLQAGLSTYIDLLLPGESLNFVFNFSLSNELCNMPQINSVIFGNFSAENFCDDAVEFLPIEIDNSNLNSLITLLSAQSCCQAPPEVPVIHACGLLPSGSIEVSNTNPTSTNDIIATLIYPNNSQPPNVQIISSDSPTSYIFDNLAAGSYHLILFNYYDGSYFTQDVNIEDYSFSASLTSDLSTICQGSPVTLTADATPTESPSEEPFVFTYDWTPTNASTTNTSIYNPDVTTDYQVTVSNGSCSVTTNAITITVNPNPIVSITATPGTTIQLGISVNLEATFSPAGADVSWFGPNIISGTNPITASPTENSDYTVTVTANDCSTHETISIQVVDAPLACIQEPNTIVIPDGFTSSQLIEFMQTNFPSNIISPAASGQTYWEILPNNGDVLNFALIGEFHNDIELLLFRNVDFYCNSNSAIINSISNNALAFIFCNFYVCGQNQWRGIENAGLLFALGCNINNAGFAINASENSLNYLLGNTFDNNFVGFYADLPQGSSIYFYNRENTYTNTGTLLPTFILNTLFNFNKSICGIYLNNAGNIQIDQPNNSTSNTRFLDINCGISSNNTNLRVNNASFENIARHNFPPFNTPIYSGCGIYQGSNGSNTLSILPAFGINNGTTFKNCVNGIRLNHSNATIKNIGFENVGIGVLGNNLADTKVIIDKNKINALRFGIHLTAIDHAQYIVANNNDIKVESNKSNSGIYISAFDYQTNYNSNIKIQANTINVSNGLNGIQLTNIYHPKVNSNKIYRNTISPLLISYQWSGIKSENCSFADISCNQILPGASFTQNNGGADIYISQSGDTWLAANQVNGGANRGIEIQGTSTWSTIQTNEIGDHLIGLYYGTSAWVGAQPSPFVASTNTPANKWIGTFSDPNYDHPAAVNENIWFDDGNGNTILNLDAIIFNQFRVNGTSGQAPFYPENYPDNTFSTEWFRPSTLPPLAPFEGGYCISSQSGNNGGGSGVSNNTDVVTNVGPYMQAASGNVNSTQYSPETAWMLKKELLKILAIEDSLRNSNETLFFFYNNSTNDNIKELLSIEERLRTVNEIITINRYLMNLNDSILAIKDSLILSNLILANDNSQQDYAMEQINNLNQEYIAVQQENRQLLNQITQIRQDSVLISEQRNIEFSPYNFNEYLLKQVNEIYFKSYAKGLDTLTLDDIEVLENIIHICPQAGGPAVYKARALYATINDSIVYNDSVVCRQIGYYRTIKDEIETKIIEAKKEISLSDKSTENVSFSLFPNPVKDKLTVKINGEIEIGILKIVDSLGKTIFQQDIKKNQKEILIDANKYSEGYYVLQISSGNYIGNQKFIK